MGIGSWLGGLFGTLVSVTIVSDEDDILDPGPINPATGLPMVGGVDVMGNPRGVDLSPPDHYDHSHMNGISHDMGIGLAAPDYSSPSFGHDRYYD